MMLVMLFAQSAIGVTNDIFDVELDTETKPWKPIPRGAVSRQAAQWLAVALVVATTALALTLGLASFALAMLGMACGLAYDAWFKRSVFSAVPFMIAIPTLPLWVWATLGEWETALWWLFPLGALIGLSLHLANTLPDIEADARHGVRGLAHRLGRTGSAAVGWSSFALALMLSALLAPALDYDLRVYVPAALAGVVALALSVGLYAVRRDGFALQAGFGIIGIAAAVLAVGWLASVT
jgi:4-hydroxybenzoate polyprenyltransferase